MSFWFPAVTLAGSKGPFPPDGLLWSFSRDFGIFVMEALVLGPVPLEVFSMR